MVRGDREGVIKEEEETVEKINQDRRKCKGRRKKKRRG